MSFYLVPLNFTTESQSKESLWGFFFSMCMYVWFVLFCFGFLFFGVFRFFCLDFFSFNVYSSDSRICPVAEMGKIHVLNVFYYKEGVSNRKHEDVRIGICRW